jgi:hypothetical protein
MQIVLWAGIEDEIRIFWKLSIAGPCKRRYNVGLRISLRLALKNKSLKNQNKFNRSKFWQY